MPAWSHEPAPEVTDLAEDLRRIFQELDRQGGRPATATAGQCNPALDVLETDEAVEILMDLPGVAPGSVRVVLKGGVVLVAGEKLPAPPTGAGAGDFHIVERGFGRFARAIRVTAAVDGSRAAAHFAAGVLRIVLPRIHDRRGQARVVPIGGPPAPGRH